MDMKHVITIIVSHLPLPSSLLPHHRPVSLLELRQLGLRGQLDEVLPGDLLLLVQHPADRPGLQLHLVDPEDVLDLLQTQLPSLGPVSLLEIRIIFIFLIIIILRLSYLKDLLYLGQSPRLFPLSQDTECHDPV